MTDAPGDIVRERSTGRVGQVVKVKGNRVRVRFTDTEQFRRGHGAQEVNFNKKHLDPVIEERDMPGHVRRAERTA